MVDRKRGLGRGLSELLGNQATAPTSASEQAPAFPTLPLSALHPCPHQPRVEIDPTSLEELSQSIHEKGILQPIIVRPMGDHYEIVAGERRWRAAQMAGLTEAPVVIRELDDEEAMTIALIENIQREDLNPMDIALALERLLKTFSDITHENLAKLVGKSRSAVTNFLRLLALEGPVKLMLRNGDLEMGHARALLALKEELQVQSAKTIVDKGLSVRATEQLIRQQQAKALKPAESNPSKPLDETLLNYQQQLADQLKTHVKIKPRGKKGESGDVVIRYNDRHTLKTLIDLLL